MLNEIRPHHFKYMAEAMLLQDIVELLDREFEETSSCPGCESKNKKYKFSKYDMKFDQCLNCQTIFMNPRPKETSMNIYYATSRNYKYWAENIFPESSQARTELICIPSINRIKRIIEPYNKLRNLNVLEIGPGFGIFANQCIKDKVFSSYEVIEPTPSLAQHCKDIGIKVHETNIEKFSSKKKYQLVCAFEVIEHLYDPSILVKSCYELLSNDGFLVLSCPNGIGFDTKMLGAFSPSVDNEHVNLFSPEGLEILLKNNNFKVISILTPGKMDVEIVEECIKENPGFFACEKEFFRLMNECSSSKEKLQSKIANQNDSGHLWIFAQKKSIPN